MAVAERYLKHRNIPAQKNVLKRLADIIEERINTASYEYEAFISKYEEQGSNSSSCGEVIFFS